MKGCEILGSLNSFLCCAIWGQDPVFSHPEFSEFRVGSGCSLVAVRWQAFFPFWVPSRFTSSPSAVATVDGEYDIVCLLIWQEIFRSSHMCSVAKSCPILCDPMNYSLLGSMGMGLPRQEYWDRVPFPPPGDRPDQGMEVLSPALMSGFFTTGPLVSPFSHISPLCVGLPSQSSYHNALSRVRCAI